MIALPANRLTSTSLVLHNAHLSQHIHSLIHHPLHCFRTICNFGFDYFLVLGTCLYLDKDRLTSSAVLCSRTMVHRSPSFYVSEILGLIFQVTSQIHLELILMTTFTASFTVASSHECLRHIVNLSLSGSACICCQWLALQLISLYDQLLSTCPQAAPPSHQWSTSNP